MNILLIDDDEITRKLLSYNFLEQGHNISTAGNGQEALTLLASNKTIDLIVVDLFMPELSGPSFLLKLSRMFYGKSPVIIVVSGARNAEEFLNKLDTKYDYFFSKPINFTELNACVKNLGLH
ncbi:MAG: response regulator transcription factor [Bacteroidia bacterium]|nr:response regulator transcription factor [Bacteroidia bacterium]